MQNLLSSFWMQEDVKGSVGKFLEYVVNNHHVSREPVTIFKAFQISLVRMFFSSLCFLYYLLGSVCQKLCFGSDLVVKRHILI